MEKQSCLEMKEYNNYRITLMKYLLVEEIIELIVVQEMIL
jgi:hypothetical protein